MHYKMSGWMERRRYEMNRVVQTYEWMSAENEWVKEWMNDVNIMNNRMNKVGNEWMNAVMTVECMNVHAWLVPCKTQAFRIFIV